MNETPERSPIHVEMDGPIWLKLRMNLPALPPEEILRWFTDPARLAQWMGDEHVVELVPGGRYEIYWNQARRSMEGSVIVARPTELVFSWTFAHEPETPARVVMVRAAAQDNSSSTLVVIHGPYRDDMKLATASGTEDEDRAGHLEGWNAFLPVLRDRMVAAVASPV